MKPPLVLFVCFGLSMSALAQTPPAPAPSGDGSLPHRPLSAETRAKIATMTPLFDGKTLAGWVQAPPAPVSFAAGDLTDLPALAQRLKQPTDPVAKYVAAQLDEMANTALASFVAPGANAKELTTALVKNLNRIAGQESFYADAQIPWSGLRAETVALLATKPSGLAALRLNRMLLEDAFSHELWTSPLVSWTVKDGAMASTGAGRGVIYTPADYAHYRLIFLLRHVAGKPDHQPCVLIFCTRPAPGEKGLDALGGIQFQAPNGGHWDYRPGHNNGGTAFTNPVKTRYDSHDWCQVELLVNAADGTARMAVAGAPGMRASENLVFHEPAAGRVGPIAWQMHNTGLFDEFKEVRIEVDPVEDRLITVE